MFRQAFSMCSNAKKIRPIPHLKIHQFFSMKKLIFVIAAYLCIAYFSKKVNNAIAGKVAIAIFKDGKPLLLKCSVFADLNWGIKLSASATFEIGPILQ